MQKSMSQALQKGIWTGLRLMVCPEHASEMPEMCSGTRKAQTLFKSNDCDFISTCDIDVCTILLHSATFDSSTKLLVAVHINFFFVIKIITCFWAFN